MLPFSAYAVFYAMGAVSPTLLRMLSVGCNLVTLRDLGDAPCLAL